MGDIVNGLLDSRKLKATLGTGTLAAASGNEYVAIGILALGALNIIAQAVLDWKYGRRTELATKPGYNPETKQVEP